MTSNNYRGLKEGYRSGFEEEVVGQLVKSGVEFVYEGQVIRYAQPVKDRKYTPDFIFTGSPIIIETKGRFVTADRQKHLLVKAQHPELDIRFVFSNPKARISKISKTTYAMWCEKNGFKYAWRTVPPEWLAEIRQHQKENNYVTEGKNTKAPSKRKNNNAV